MVEAEDFHAQEKDGVRKWYVVSKDSVPDVNPDGDGPNWRTASGGAYLEILPDTRRSHGDKLVHGENFMPQPGKMAVLSYKIKFTNAGRYYCWVRTYSTNTEDNGIHLGINGAWPESGARMQWTAKNRWHWDTKQRTQKVHTGVFGKIWIEVPKPGVHTIQFSMREDGFEFDRFLLTKEKPNAKKLPAGLVNQKEVKKVEAKPELEKLPDLQKPREDDGDGKLVMVGTMVQWQAIDVTLDGPFAYELDQNPNPFLDYRFEVTFRHESGGEEIPGAGVLCGGWQGGGKFRPVRQQMAGSFFSGSSGEVDV